MTTHGRLPTKAEREGMRIKEQQKEERIELLETLLETLLIEAYEAGDSWTIERIEAAIGALEKLVNKGKL
jgi:hypothetical protein